jgi:hypothetical protein
MTTAQDRGWEPGGRAVSRAVNGRMAPQELDQVGERRPMTRLGILSPGPHAAGSPEPGAPGRPGSA